MLSRIINSIKKAIRNEEYHELDIIDLKDWFIEKRNEYLNNLHQKSELEIKNLKNKLRAFNKDLMVLAQTNLNSYTEETKDKIHDAIIDYVSISKNFIKKLLVQENEFDSFLDIIENFDLLLREYEQETKPNKEFLEDILNKEIQDCEESLNEIKEYFETLQKKFTRQKLEELEELGEKINTLKDINEKRSKLNEKKERILDNLKKMVEIKSKFLDKIEDLKQSPDFGKYNETVIKRRIMIDKINEIKEIFEHDFSKLKDAIKLYQIKNYKQIFKKYLKDPFNTLLEDEGEKFTETLTDLKSKIEKDEIKLASINKRKSIETIEKLNKDYLFSTVEEYKDSKKDKIKYDKILSTSKIMSDYSEVDYKIEHINKKIKAQKDVLRETLREIKTVEINKTLTEIENKIKELFNTNILITQNSDKNDNQ